MNNSGKKDFFLLQIRREQAQTQTKILASMSAVGKSDARWNPASFSPGSEPFAGSLISFLFNSDLNLEQLVDEFSRGTNIAALPRVQLRLQTLKRFHFARRQTPASS
jgi:hypothetical protein